MTSDWFVDEVGGYGTVSHAGSLGDCNAHIILVPGADGLGIAVEANASAFIAAGHAGQYELSLGLLRLLLDLEPESAGPSMLTTLVALAVAWGLGLLVVVAALRYLLRFRLGRALRSRGGLRPWLRQVLLPTGAYLADAAFILAGVPALTGFPMATAQVFYPDVAWGLTVTGSSRSGGGWVARRSGSKGFAPPGNECVRAPSRCSNCSAWSPQLSPSGRRRRLGRGQEHRARRN